MVCIEKVCWEEHEPFKSCKRLNISSFQNGGITANKNNGNSLLFYYVNLCPHATKRLKQATARITINDSGPLIINVKRQKTNTYRRIYLSVHTYLLTFCL